MLSLFFISLLPIASVDCPVILLELVSIVHLYLVSAGITFLSDNSGSNFKESSEHIIAVVSAIFGAGLITTFTGCISLHKGPFSPFM